MKERYKVIEVSFNEVKPFILNIHYAKRMPQVIYKYGLFENDDLVGVATYGRPVNYRICEGICGIDNKDKVYELNRLVLLNNKYNEASILISKSMKLVPQPSIILSYADTSRHIGTIYRACNFYFIGETEPKVDYVSNKHHRHSIGVKRVRRSIKYRYVYFTGSKKQRRYFKESLTYPILNYPDNSP